MKSGKVILVGVVILIAIGVGVWLGISPPWRQVQADEIVFGGALPLTGESLAEYGKRCQAGMDLAVEHINEGGGINGQTLRIQYEDTEGSPTAGVSALRKLIDVHYVRVVIGAVGSSITLAMEPIATENEVILFSPASSSPKLTGKSRFFFRNWPSDVFEATALAQFVYHELDIRSVGILWVNNDYGLGLKDEFKREFEELAGRVPAIETYEQDATDFRTQLARISASGPEAIYLAGYHREMAAATRQIRELGLTVQILGDGDYGVDELLVLAGDAAEGAIYSIPEYNPEADDQAVREFSAAFEAEYGRQSSIFEANGYDAVRVLALAVEEAGLDTNNMVEFLVSLKDYPGASGLTTFGEMGEVVKPVAIRTVRNGEFVDY